MNESADRIFPVEVVECVASGRSPSIHELYSLAARIGRDIGSRPIFDWTSTTPVPSEHALLLRAAQMALNGSD